MMELGSCSCSHTKIKLDDGYTFDISGEWTPHIFIVCRRCDRTVAQYKQVSGITWDELVLKHLYIFKYDATMDKLDATLAHKLR